jgi:pimeloyl-ACP methyl ester carboxylesterase/DNA-binding SARP family transcriptional activator
MTTKLTIKVLGELEVLRAGEAVRLPSSKRTRALLAYLALTGRPHRRERLCELLWELPDDPRGALRWSLSKLRPIVNEDGIDRIMADRERVALDLSSVEIDLARIRGALEAAEDLPLSELRAMAGNLSSELLDGADLPQQDAFQAWLTEERADAARLRILALKRLSNHPDLEPRERYRWTRLWLDADPFDRSAVLSGASILTAMGQADEANALISRFNRHAQEAARSTIEPGYVLANGLDRNGPEHNTEARASNLGERQSGLSARQLLKHQTIGFCRARDGTRIAYATVGEGPPLVKAANWLNHLELDWDSPIWGRTFQSYADGRRFIRYDERGNGLSDWEVEDLTFDAFVQDLETVVDSLALDRFPLIGMSQGCAVSVEYAVRHPERVSALVLLSGYANGWRTNATEDEHRQREAVMTLTYHGWGQNNPAYRHIFSQTFMPMATAEELAWFDEFQRQTTSPGNAVRFLKVFADIDVRERLAAVGVPTLVLHSTRDRRVPLQFGMELAAGIPNARFVPLDSDNHIILEHEAAWRVCNDEITAFLDAHGV